MAKYLSQWPAQQVSTLLIILSYFYHDSNTHLLHDLSKMKVRERQLVGTVVVLLVLISINQCGVPTVLMFCWYKTQPATTAATSQQECLETGSTVPESQIYNYLLHLKTTISPPSLLVSSSVTLNTSFIWMVTGSQLPACQVSYL